MYDLREDRIEESIEMKTLLTIASCIVASSPEKITGRNDQPAVTAASQLEIVNFQRIRKLPT